MNKIEDVRDGDIRIAQYEQRLQDTTRRLGLALQREQSQVLETD